MLIRSAIKSKLHKFNWSLYLIVMIIKNKIKGNRRAFSNKSLLKLKVFLY